MLPQTRKKPYSRMNDMKNILKTLIISASFLTLFLPSAFCEKIIFSANSMSGTVGDKSDSTTLSGEAYVLTESMEISADKITMSGKDFRFIEAEGSIIGKNMESELEALPELAGCQVHSTVMLSEIDRKIFRKLGIDLTCDPVRK